MCDSQGAGELTDIFPVSEKENLVASPVSAKKEESHKREINRDGEKEDRNKKLRKTESKENIPVSVEKKQVPISIHSLIYPYECR